MGHIGPRPVGFRDKAVYSSIPPADAGDAGAGGLLPHPGPDVPAGAGGAGDHLLDTLGGAAPGQYCTPPLLHLPHIIIVSLQ